MRILTFFLILAFMPLFADEECMLEPAQIALVQETPEKQTPPPPPTFQEEKEPSDIYKSTESYETAFIKTIVVLVGLLVLVVLTVWMFKKISHGRLKTFNSLKSIKILEKRPLSPKSMLYLIEVAGKQVLIAESQLEVRAITSLDWLAPDKDL